MYASHPYILSRRKTIAAFQSIPITVSNLLELSACADCSRAARMEGGRWRQEMQPSDRIERSHFRHLRSIHVDSAPRLLVTGGTPCIRIELCGNSFMLHQIRQAFTVDLSYDSGPG